MNEGFFVSATVLVVTLMSVFAARPGAYYDAADEVKAAAVFAVKEEGMRIKTPVRLKQVVQAQKQIVAGTNYHLVMLVGKDGREQQAEAVVFAVLICRRARV